MSTPELHWFKSSHSSGPDPGDCVEVATTPAVIRIRDSKNKLGAQLALSAPVWGEFVAYVSK
ncbi:DUF397 domain-containing protein [Streptomyces sp. W16]|uniref:DUF397 domain-containing protein n=1 Tax=Streptomyces sp. W16 TaxID=3076631 RepID=UPI00295BE230|nr:DUF397 domain-containing protein [Streptomyces sp. W16]MDV9172894.1 DUF397 domain-containing protein [Streptomyces sp. W16]